MDQLLINGEQRSGAVAGGAVGMSGKEGLPARQERAQVVLEVPSRCHKVPLQQSPTAALRISHLFIPPHLSFGSMAELPRTG